MSLHMIVPRWIMGLPDADDFFALFGEGERPPVASPVLDLYADGPEGGLQDASDWLSSRAVPHLAIDAVAATDCSLTLFDAHLIRRVRNYGVATLGTAESILQQIKARGARNVRTWLQGLVDREKAAQDWRLEGVDFDTGDSARLRVLASVIFNGGNASNAPEAPVLSLRRHEIAELGTRGLLRTADRTAQQRILAATLCVDDVEVPAALVEQGFVFGPDLLDEHLAARAAAGQANGFEDYHVEPLADGALAFWRAHIARQTARAAVLTGPTP